MDELDFLILRTPPRPPQPMGLEIAGFGGFEPGIEDLTLETRSLSSAERRDAEGDPEVHLAPTMPMQLIVPVPETDESEDENGPGAQPAAAATWGVEAVGADTSPFDGTGVVVAVLDTGIDPDHDAFDGVTLVRRNFTTGPDDDEHGHGTHCAGTVFGKDVNGERIGIARNVNKAIIGKVLGPGGGSSATVASAIQWAVTEGAHVISMSLGIDFPGYVDFLKNDQGIDIIPATSIALAAYRDNINLFNTLAQFVRAQGAFGQGTVLVAASGNESNRPAYTVDASPPSAGVDITAVGALADGPHGYTVAEFSNIRVDVSAPGVHVRSARLGGGLRFMSGTSMATPHVAGVAALWAQKLLETNGSVNGHALTAQLIGKAITSTLATPFSREDVGTGIVQTPQA